MLAGRLPFRGDTAPAMMLAAASQTPPALGKPRADVPDALARIVERALEKDPARRTISADEIARAIADWQARSSAGAIGASTARRSTTRWWAALAVVALLAAALPGAWFVRQSARVRWAREQALPQIDQLSEREEYVAAFQLAQEAKRYIPTDPVWKRIDLVVSRPVTVRTTPAGATVSYRPVGSKGERTRLGSSPIVNAAVPAAYLEWRFEKPGYVTQSDAAAFFIVPGLTFDVTFHTAEQTPPGMVLRHRRR